MGFFPLLKKRVLPPASSYTLSTAYQRVRFEVPRLAHIESMELRIGIEMDSGTADNVSFTKLMDGLANVVSKVSFTAGNYAYINNVSGASLLRYAANVDVLDDVTEQAIAQTTTADYAVTYAALRGAQAAKLMEDAISTAITIPLYFAHPQILEPNNAPLMVPMPKFSLDGVLDVDLGKLAEIATLGTGVTSIIVYPVLVVNYRVVPDSVPHFRHVLGESQVSLTATGDTEFKLDSTGTYTGLQVTFLNNSYVETDPCASGGTMRFGIGATTEIEVTPKEMLVENSRSRIAARGLFMTASPYFDFLTQGLGATVAFNTAKNANVSNVGSQQYWLKTNVDTLTTSVVARYTYHRVEGDLSSLKLQATA